MKNIFIYISIFFFLLSLIFLLIQGIINFKFSRFNDRKIIVEKTLYEQFSYEVYSSINKKISINFSIKSECSPEEEELEFNLNLDTFFDCRGIHNDDLKLICQNEIVNNYTNCEPNSNIIINNDENWNILDNDHRNLFCHYYSKFTRRISTLYNTKICKSKKSDQYDYKQLLKNSVPRNDYRGNPNECQSGYKKCGILDTKDNILCLPIEKECPKNIIGLPSENENNKIKIDNNIYISLNNNNEFSIVNSIIISENKPLNHEWEKMIRETYEKLENKDKKKRRILSGEDFQLLDSKEDDSYKILNGFNPLYLKVAHIKDNNNLEGIYNSNQYLNIYIRSYIGFKDYEELDKFETIFNDKNDRDNPLYQLSSSKHDPLTTIILPVFFFVVSIVYLIIKIKNILEEEEKISKIFFYIFFCIIILFFLGELIIIIEHFRKYTRINIDMDYRMRKVLDRYNERRFKCQKYRIISLSFNFISIVCILITFRATNKK